VATLWPFSWATPPRLLARSLARTALRVLTASNDSTARLVLGCSFAQAINTTTIGKDCQRLLRNDCTERFFSPLGAAGQVYPVAAFSYRAREFEQVGWRQSVSSLYLRFFSVSPPNPFNRSESER
jgi:hypothetical protein